MSRCQNLTLCPEEWQFLKHRQTKIVKHTNSHISPRSRGAACVFQAKGCDERHLRRPAGERAEAQGVDHMPVIQFDCAYLSSVNEKGEQVRMRAVLDTSTGLWHSFCDWRERRRRQVCDLFCGVVLERIGVHKISMQDGSRACDQGNGGCGHQVFVR